MSFRLPLFLAGVLCLALAALHLGMIPFGAPAYRFFGAGEAMARMAEAGSWVPALLTLAIAALLALFGLYGLSGAGRFRRLPLLRPMLTTLGGVFLLRGLALGLEVSVWLRHPAFPVRFLAFSAASLLLGLLFLGGVGLGWRVMGARR